MAEKGFTLIEIMITVAIIGILAAFAISAYLDYTIRAHVTEGLNLASTAELAVNEYVFTNNELPATAADTYYTAPASTASVSSIVMGNSGVFTINYTAVAGNGSIIFVPTIQSDVLLWDCKGGSLALKYRPPECR